MNSTVRVSVSQPPDYGLCELFRPPTVYGGVRLWVPVTEDYINQISLNDIVLGFVCLLNNVTGFIDFLLHFTVGGCFC